LIEALKSLFNLATAARNEGHEDEAERLYKEAAEQARAQDTVGRAEALIGAAQIRRRRGDRAGASIYLSEAITLLRNESAQQPECIAPTLAYALTHAAELRGELGENAVAGTQIEEAVRLYRAIQPLPTLDLANALRVSALNSERAALAAWTEAQSVYIAIPQNDRIDEAQEHLEHLQQLAPADRTSPAVNRQETTP
jgi:tetratricopeptide (TPR) repeat protein